MENNNNNDHDGIIEDIVIEPPSFPSNNNNNNNHDTTTNVTTTTTSAAFASSSSESYSSSSLFFADATLDLTVAHDIADTPEAKQQQHRQLLLRTTTNNTTTTANDNNSATNTITANHNIQNKNQPQQPPLEWIPPPLPFTSSTNVVLLSEDTTKAETTTNDNDVMVKDDHTEDFKEEDPTTSSSSLPNRISNFDSIISSSSSSTTTVTTTTATTTNHHHSSSSLPSSPSSLPSPSNRIQNHHQNHNNNNNNNNRIIPPKYPRDLFWMIVAILIIPISLLYPIFVIIIKGDGSTSTSSISITNSTNITNTNSTSSSNNNNNNVLAHHPLSFATIHAITWTIIVCIFMIRLLYRNQNSSNYNYNNYSSTSNNSNTSSNNMNMAVLLTALAPLSIFIYFLLTLTVLYICLFETNTTSTTWWIIVFIPFYLWIREVFLYRTYWTRHTDSINDMGYISRTTFFHELYTMSITEIILHKSKLQHRRLIRIVSIILIGQGMMILLWRTSLLHVLNHNNNNSSTSSSSLTFLIHVGYIWIIGVWCTSCITKCLNYLVSGAILLWSMEQSERLIQLQQQQQQQFGTATTNDNDDDDDEDGSSILSRHSRNSIPEAYRTVDASVYQSVSFRMDDLHLDDDDDDDDDNVINNNNNDDHDDDMEYQPQRRMDSNATYTYLNGSRGRNKSISRQQQHQLAMTHHRMTDTNHITMKSMIRMGLRMNLGSIIHCGTVSNISQWIYSHLQYLDYIRQQRQQYRQQHSISNNNNNNNNTINNNNSTGGFQGMVIGHGDTATTTIYYHRIAMIGSMIRYYIQYHNDLPMTHVATYYKSYSRATRDVTSIIQESGLEPILQEDITRQICASICSTISGVIVLITTYLLLHQRKNSVNSADITELHVAETMFLSYMYSYTLLHTAFEPIRAAIQASYIAFAQNPHCFLHTYPLIYHRLSRLSSATVATTA